MANLTSADGARSITVPDEVAADYIAQGWINPSAAPVPTYPEGDPSDSWKVAELTAYAAARGIDLGEAKKKPDVLEAILIAPEPQEPDQPEE